MKSQSIEEPATLACAEYQHQDCAARQGHRNKEYNQYDLSGDYGIGYTSKGEEFYFDLEDYNKIKDYCWFLNEDGYVLSNDAETRRHIRFHRLVMNACDGEQVDHIQHKTNDNRKSQLRLVSNAQNSMNRSIQSNNTSGVVGVYWDNSKQRWCAEIKINKKKIYLGIYKNFEDAVAARKAAEEKYFGEYSYDNSRKDA